MGNDIRLDLDLQIFFYMLLSFIRGGRGEADRDQGEECNTPSPQSLSGGATGNCLALL